MTLYSNFFSNAIESVETKENQSGAQLSRIVRIMGEVRVDQAIITDVKKDKS